MPELLRCPKCAAGLSHVIIRKKPEYGGTVLHEAQKTNEIEVDQCIACGGIWFDANELQQYLDEKLFLLQSPDSRISKKINEKPADCPICKKLMRKDILPKWRNVIADLCDSCGGIWLDGGEIEKLSDAAMTFSEKVKLLFLRIRDARKGNKAGDEL